MNLRALKLRPLLESFSEYPSYEQRLNDLFKQFLSLGVCLVDEDDNFFYHRIAHLFVLEKRKKEMKKQSFSASDAYLILKILYQRLVQAFNKEDPHHILKMSKAIGLLDICSLTYEPLLNICGTAEEARAGVDLREFLKTKNMLDETSQSELIKKLIDGKVMLETGGVYAAIVEGAKLTTDGTNIRLEEGINFRAIFVYLQFINDLTLGMENIFQLFHTLKESELKKYAPLLNHLSPQYLAENVEYLTSALSNPNYLAQAISEEKAFETAFREVPRHSLRTILPEPELFHLVVFDQEEKNENIALIWPAGDPFVLQSAVKTFLEASSKFPNNKNLANRIWQIMADLPFHFDVKFILQFIQDNFVEEQNAYYKIIFEKYIQKHKLLLEWLEQLDFSLANRILDIMKSIEFPVEYSILYAGSEKLKGTNVLKEYARHLISLTPETTETKVEEVVYPKVAKHFDDEYKMLAGGNLSIDKFVALHMEELQKYARLHLTLHFNDFIGKFGVPNERGIAYQKLISLFNVNRAGNKSFSWQEFEKLFNDSAFRMQAGFFEGKPSVLHSRHTLWGHVLNIKKDIQSRIEFFKKFQNAELLIKFISEDTYFSILQPDDFGFIFQYCVNPDNSNTRYNRILFLKLLDENKRLNNWQPFVVDNTVMDARTIHVIVSQNAKQITQKNQLLKKLKISIKSSEEFLLPGPEINTGNHLSKELSYQVQESDINVAEHFLFNAYRSVFINKLEDHEQKQEVSEEKSSLKFYQVPTALMTPKIAFDVEKNRYGEITKRKLKEAGRTFVNELQNLVLTYQPQENEPIIFAGILNYGHNHYVPYFIYVGLNQKIQVICVDPSPQITPSDRCGKKGVLEDLTFFFKEIVFKNKDCIVSDPNVTQQLRQRDCGFNALTVQEDAYRLSTTAEPLFKIQEGTLLLDESRLSMNGNDKRIYNADSDTFLYSVEVTQQSEKNRLKWAERLYQIEVELSVGKCSAEPIHVNTVLSLIPSSSYSYSSNVQNQRENDHLGDLYNRVALLVGSIDHLCYYFLQSMDIPNQTEAVIKAAYYHDKKLAEDIVQAGETFESITRTVIERNIEPYYSQALLNHFDHYLLRCNISFSDDKHYQDQLLNSIIDGYLKTSKVNGFFSKLNNLQKESLIKNLQKKVQLNFNKRMENYHLQQVDKALAEELVLILKMTDDKPDIVSPQTVDDVIGLFSRVSKYSLIFKEMYANANKCNELRTKVKGAINSVLREKFEDLTQIVLSFAPEKMNAVAEKYAELYVIRSELSDLALTISADIQNSSSFKELMNSVQGSQYATKELQKYLLNIVEQHLGNLIKNKKSEKKSNFQAFSFPRENSMQLEKREPYEVTQFKLLFENFQSWIALYKKAVEEFKDIAEEGSKQLQEIEAELKHSMEKPTISFYESGARLRERRYTLALFTRFIELMLTGFRMGDVRLQEVTPKLRLMVYHALDIQPKIYQSIFLSSYHIKEMDEKIKRFYTNSRNSNLTERYDYLNGILTKELGKSTSRLPCKVTPTHMVPDTTHHPHLTPRLLTQLVANWKLSLLTDGIGRHYYSDHTEAVLLKQLLHVINQIPVNEQIQDDTPLSTEWCDHYIKPILNDVATYAEMQKYKTAANFLNALINCVGCTPPLQQASQDNLKIADLEKLYTLHKEKKATRYLKMAKQATFGSFTSDEYSAKNVKHNFFERGLDDMDKVKLVMNVIKQRHQQSLDANLDGDDFQLLNNLINQYTRQRPSKDPKINQLYQKLEQFAEEGRVKLLQRSSVEAVVSESSHRQMAPS